MHYIYKITNLVNQKIYIGQSKNPKYRWTAHKREAKQEFPQLVVEEAMKKYGIENFIFELICSVIPVNDEKQYYLITSEIETELVTQEQSHISLKKGYNVSRGGSNAPKTEEWKQKVIAKRKSKDNYKHSEEYKQNAREKWHQWHTPESIQKTADSNRGRPCSEGRKEKIAKANKGKQYCLGHKQPQEVIEKRKASIAALYGDKKCNVPGCEKIDGFKFEGIRYCEMHVERLKRTGSLELRPRPSPPNKGKPMSEESKQKLSAALKGRIVHNKGIPCSEETKEKLRLLNLGKEPPNKIKFSEDQINLIISDNRSLRKIAKDFNVSTTVIARIKKFSKQKDIDNYA